MRKIDAVECKRVADLIRQSFEHCGHDHPEGSEDCQKPQRVADLN